LGTILAGGQPVIIIISDKGIFGPPPPHFCGRRTIQAMHLNTEATLDFVEGRLNKEEEAFWKKHMEICSDCVRTVKEWTQLRMDLRGTDLVSGRERDLQNVYEILEPGTGSEPAAPRSTLATIVFDSFLQPAPAGARGGSGPAARQLVMRAEEFDI